MQPSFVSTDIEVAPLASEFVLCSVAGQSKAWLNLSLQVVPAFLDLFPLPGSVLPPCPPPPPLTVAGLDFSERPNLYLGTPPLVSSQSSSSISVS